MSLNINDFIQDYSSIFGSLTAENANNLKLLLGFLDQDILLFDPRWKAYCLATVRRECGRSYAPITEIGEKAYFQRYEIGKLGVQLGNTNPGDGYTFRGRGYVQLTGRMNYFKLGAILKIDLIGDPDRALIPNVAYNIMSYGMRKGTFTGHSLSQYIGSSSTDYFNARKIINGLDHAEDIAANAGLFESMFVRHTTK